jgi:RND family efflux transporter MFP subunit
MARMRRRLALALLYAVLVACKRGPEAEPLAAPKLVKCVPVQSAMVKDTIEVRGTVAPLPARDAQVAPQVSGRLLRVEVREGDTVVAGQVVARVDDGPLVDVAHQAEAALARARAERQNARTTLARVERVFAHGIVARQEVDDATAKEASARAAEAETEAAARQAHRQIDRATVHSPLAGVVLKVLRKPGELVDGTPATAVVEIADTSELDLAADVPTSDLVRLIRGAPATVTFSALPGQKFNASVSRVSPAVDRLTGVGSARIGIQRSESASPPIGAFGVARIESGEPHPSILVPVAAVRSVVGGEGEVIVCGTDHVAHVHKVRPGSTRDGLVEARGDLGSGDRVAVEPVLGLSEGDAITSQP